MKRSLQHVKVCEIDTDKGPVSVFLSLSETKFFATVGTVCVEGATIQEVREKAKVEALDLSDLVWRPIIFHNHYVSFKSEEVSNVDGRKKGSSFNFSYYRAEIATRKTEKSVGAGCQKPKSTLWLRPFLDERGNSDQDYLEDETWETLHEDRKQQIEKTAKKRLQERKRNSDAHDGTYQLRESSWNQEDKVYIDYTPERWHALGVLSTMIEQACRRLDEILSTKHAAQNLDGAVAELAKRPLLALSPRKREEDPTQAQYWVGKIVRLLQPVTENAGRKGSYVFPVGEVMEVKYARPFTYAGHSNVRLGLRALTMTRSGRRREPRRDVPSEAVEVVL